MARQYCKAVCTNLVCYITVSGNPVGANDDPPDLTCCKNGGRSTIGIQCHRNSISHQLPGGKAATLKPGPGFIRINLLEQLLLMKPANHTQRGTIATCCKRACVAVGQDRDRRGAVGAGRKPHCLEGVIRHGKVTSKIFLMNGDGFIRQPPLRFAERVTSVKHPLHSLQGPEQIHGGWPGSR